MSRTTIDFGIDLGTTNSAIAVLRGTATDIIKNNLDTDITPSAVYIDKRGTQVGQRAKGKLEYENSADDVYTEFKRLMGNDHKYRFKTAARILLPEEVSAEVLKSLRGDVQQRLAEDIQAAVITVPAAFEQKQCAATKRAGELAGFELSPLLQEPVAAALAYGFQSDVTKEYWLVYDFGGGTFDAAIMKAEDGSITVVNHGGDPYLGGSDIDWAIVEQLIIPHLTANYNFPGLSRSNTKWRTALAVIKRSAEMAKIQLSRSASAVLEDCHIKDADGKDVDVSVTISKDDIIALSEPFIMRSVSICQRVLEEKHLAPNAIERMILVGGPTLAPYFRELLHSNLEIQLDHTVDPLTVVARGAAVFAGTQRLEGRAAPKAAAGQFSIDLKYKPVGADEDPTVRGEVKAPASAPTEGFAIEFINQQTHWRSGKVPIKADGRFKLNLLAEKGSQNIFTIELFDSRGTKQSAVPDKITYTIGLAISEQPIINSIAVALANNDADFFFKKGEGLPAKATRVYRTTHELKKGETGEVLKVPVVEGEIELADRNRLLGSLEIKGAKIRRDLPAGTEVEVTLHIDASRILRAKAYIPMLDEEYEAVISLNAVAPDPQRLKKEYDAEVKRLDALRDQAGDADDDKAGQILEDISPEDELEPLVEAAKGDPVAANQAEKRMLELKIALDRAENSLKWPALVSDANKALDDLDKLIAEHGNEQHQQRADKLREQVDDLVSQKHAEALKKKTDQIMDLHREILFDVPGFWVWMFNSVIEERARMRDPSAAERLVAQGRQAIQRGNVEALRSSVVQLLQLLPRDIAEAVQRGYGSGLLK